MRRSESDDHGAAVEEFGRLAGGVPREAWRHPRGEGKWSPAQLVEHVALAYEQAAAELRGDAAGTTTTSPLRRRLLRWLVLPAILRTGRLPAGAPAPRALRPPADSAPDRDTPVARFRAAAARFEAAAVDAERGGARRRVAHPYFGALSARTTWRLLTIHTRHHARQLARRPDARRPGA